MRAPLQTGSMSFDRPGACKLIAFQKFLMRGLAAVPKLVTFRFSSEGALTVGKANSCCRLYTELERNCCFPKSAAGERR